MWSKSTSGKLVALVLNISPKRTHAIQESPKGNRSHGLVPRLLLWHFATTWPESHEKWGVVNMVKNESKWKMEKHLEWNSLKLRQDYQFNRDTNITTYNIYY